MATISRSGTIDDEPEFAEHECHDCGQLLPANQLTHTSDRVLTDSGSYRHTNSSGRREAYKHREIWLCTPCLEARAAQPQPRKWRWLGWLFPVAAVVLLAAYLGSNTIPSLALDNISNASAPLPVGNAAMEGAAATSADDGNAAGQPATVSPDDLSGTQAPSSGQTLVAPSPPQVLAPPEQSQDASPSDVGGDGAQQQGMADIDDAVRNATLEALDRGSPVHWHRDGLNGYVTVSSSTMEDGEACRNVSATMGNAERQDRSGPHLWCQDPENGSWTPR